MTKWKSGLLLPTLAILLASAAGAQPTSDVSDRVHPRANLAHEFYIGPHIGYAFLGHHDEPCACGVDTNDFLFVGGRAGYFITGNLAAELTAQHLRPDNFPAYWETTLGLLWDFTPSIPGWNTYVGAGGGISRNQLFRGRSGTLAYLAGGSEYRFSKLVGMRLELKGQYNFHRDVEESTAFGTFISPRAGRLDIEPSIGVLFHFGGAPAPVVVEQPPAPPPPPPPAPPAAPTTPVPPAPPPVVTPPPAAPREPTTDIIDFDRGRSRLTNIAKAKLDAVALRLRDNPRATVEITGYPDGPGRAGEALARQRAENAKQYLIDRHGIDASRITTRTNMTDAAHRGQDVIVVTFRGP